MSVKTEKLINFIERNGLTYDVNNIDYDVVSKLVSDEFNLPQNVFEYRSDNYTILAEENKMFPFHIQTLQDQFITNKINHYTTSKFNQSFINNINGYLFRS